MGFLGGFLLPTLLQGSGERDAQRTAGHEPGGAGGHHEGGAAGQD
jgi:hypothetical protein